MQRRQRPWRFRVRTLLAIVPLVAVALLVVRDVRNVRLQHELFNRVYTLQGRCGVEHEELRWPAYGRFVAWIAGETTDKSIRSSFEPTSQYANKRNPYPRWCVYYQADSTIVHCFVGQVEFYTQPIVDSDLSFLQAIDGLRSVRIERSLKLTDEAMSTITRIRTLRQVTILFTHISPAAIERFRHDRPDVEVKYQPSIEFMSLESKP